MSKPFSFFWEVGKIALIAFVLVAALRLFVFQPFLVRGASMEPNFHNWDYLIVDEISYRFRDPGRGEVVVFKFPNDPSQRYIKRIVGLPGETVQVQEGQVTIFRGEEVLELDESSYVSSDTPGSVKITLENGEYFVMGDNRRSSSDSRSWGTLREDLIIGRVLFRVFPWSAFAKVGSPDYESL
ncbi:MAG: signal peptidase I [Candidatus Wildermuthbacteria bacterium RIFCSPLOWO2_02_FULL_47_9c]|uniref:Signal peptidase I n=3 Tax=Patescibacteria group TaxID=1783273 RepID=A0A837IQJ6_9BACT|nr:MAG: Signal peptidase I [Candidatus Amesbacteria bacterium GW2011_GWC2_47_8]KKU92861.1 MAG: Signal peptidase I [Candidatus Yanofskybacteria bacterium GW2011_GWC1_48_11]KKW04038.1 MAG: Signal peptidase I [Parcubacteria group bacterium GW2011_GWB1_49_12]KKW08861.1 MAG: Signal peptidase I [Parcubacteria group bacterium GW2011_GWA1_49_26]KKW13824.1 MAG: Signal peptidase I [Parcubacteria group bacterium GW2011_GWA2_50_10]OHA61784.1 MAG: signal peptidase I [Candidatus Wildermuthbacteria bacterium